MKETLQMVLDQQAVFQKKLGYDENGMDVKTTSDLVHSHSMFVMEEVIEMLREMPYHKPWRDYSDLTLEEIEDKMNSTKEEWIDVFIFLMNIALFLGLDAQSIKEMYLKKLGLNHKRQEDPSLGYVLEK